MKWLIPLIIGVAVIVLGYFVVTSLQSPSNETITDYNVGGNTYYFGGQNPSTPPSPSQNPDTNNSMEIPVMTGTPVDTGTMKGVEYKVPSSPSSGIIVKGTGQFAGDKWILQGAGSGTHIQAQ